MPGLSSTTLHALRQSLAAWFTARKRPLPWRVDYAPYAVWVSEIMLQQTQMERAVVYFQRWMERFPDIRSVAEAEEDEVLLAWEGLGYYSRARNLHRAARRIMEGHRGVFPPEPEDIRALPGIGPYTAAAVASIAFNRRLACVDANVERVLARLFDIDSPVKSRAGAPRVRRLADALLTAKPREHNQALMELGALVCRKKPLCAECPLARYCRSLRLGIVHERPIPGARRLSVPISIVCGVLRAGGKLFVQRRRDGDVWAGLWEFPGGVIEENESPQHAVVREFAEETAFAVRIARELGVIRHAYTRYRITLHCFELVLDAPASAEDPLPAPAALTAATAWRWLSPGEITSLAMPAAHRKLADRMFGIKNAARGSR
ncbi:MAG: A/G-specific adenine glycosylase [Deltaproteobacteria bacterium]|jgi:A/G-specific adenine glycosylase|nr:A/G-specific adenine glycosylase [Deltaproteobacteria bacterium]